MKWMKAKKKKTPETKDPRLTFPLLSEFGTQEGYSKGGKDQARDNQVGGNLSRQKKVAGSKGLRHSGIPSVFALYEVFGARCC